MMAACDSISSVCEFCCNGQWFI